MLVMLALYIYKKIIKDPRSIGLTAILKSYAVKIKFIIPLLLISTISSDKLSTMEETISYSIINKNKTIGTIDIEKRSTDLTTIYTLDSEVKAKTIFNFNVRAKEKSIYRGDTLVFSSIYRSINKKVKLDQSLTLRNGEYILKHRKNNEILDFEVINRNLMMLFFYEPLDVKEVYCDKYKKW